MCQVRPAGVVGHGFQAILLISGPLLHQSMKPNLTRPRTYDIHSIWFYRSQCITPPIQDSLNVDHVKYCGIVIEIVFLTVSDLWKLPASGLPHQSYGLSPGAAVKSDGTGSYHLSFLQGSLWCERSNLSAILG